MADNNGKFTLDETPGGFKRSPTEKSPTQKIPAQKGGTRISGIRELNIPKGAFGPAKASGDPARRSRPQSAAARQGTKSKTRSASGKAVNQRPGVNPAAMSQRERNQIYSEKRKLERRRKQMISYAVLIFGAVLLLLILSLTVLFRVSEINIVGEAPYTDEQIIRSSGVEKGDNIIRVKGSKVESSLTNSLPYIVRAEIEKKLSGKLTIKVTATEGTLAFIAGERSIITDDKCKVLEIAGSEKALNYAVAVGVDGVDAEACEPGKRIVSENDEQIELLCTVYTAAAEAGINSITSIDISDRDYIQVVSEGRLNIIAGSSENIERKMALASKVIDRENELSPMQYGTIDLTIDGKAYFRPATEEDITLPYTEPEEQTGEAVSEEESSAEDSGS